MSWAVWARVAPAVLVLPLGGWLACGVVAVILAGALSAWLPVPPALTATALVGEVALGAGFGLLAAVPAHAAAALRGDGPEALGFAGRVWAWAVFFGLGGLPLLLAGLGRSFQALPPAAWPGLDAVVAAGDALFYGVLIFGLPTWLTALAVGPLAALIDRLGRTSLGADALLPLRPLLALLALVALLPLLLDELRGLWLLSLAGG